MEPYTGNTSSPPILSGHFSSLAVLWIQPRVFCKQSTTEASTVLGDFDLTLLCRSGCSWPKSLASPIQPLHCWDYRHLPHSVSSSYRLNVFFGKHVQSSSLALSLPPFHFLLASTPTPYRSYRFGAIHWGRMSIPLGTQLKKIALLHNPS